MNSYLKDMFSRIKGEKPEEETANASPSVSLNVYRENVTPGTAKEGDVDLLQYLDEEEFSSPKRKINVKFVAIAGALGVVALIVILAVSLSGGEGEKTKGEEQTLSNGDGQVNQFASRWLCKNPEGEDWAASFCQEESSPCVEGRTRDVKCCKVTSQGGACEEAELSECDVSLSPSTCETGHDWFCQRPVQELKPVFSRAFCSSQAFPLPCAAEGETSTSRSYYCCPKGVVCDASKAGDMSLCPGETRPTDCDPVSSAPTSESTNSNSTEAEAQVEEKNSTISASGEGRTSVGETKEEDSKDEENKSNLVKEEEKKSNKAPSPTPSPTSAPAPKPTPSPPAPAPPAPAPPAPAPVPNGVGITVYNNCGDKVFSSSHNGALPESCMNGKFCSDFNNVASFNLFVARGLWSNVGARTLVEISSHGDKWSYNLSKIKGFNVGASIDYPGGHKIVCQDVNCPDAYNICEIGHNDFNPVYTVTKGKGMVVTFCPSGGNTNSPVPNTRFKYTAGSAPFFCKCSNQVFEKTQDPPAATSVC